MTTRFNHNDPFEDTERTSGERSAGRERERFNHNDPFEDTERFWWVINAPVSWSFNHNDPFEDTESRADLYLAEAHLGFNHNDPFEDTESPDSAVRIADGEPLFLIN